MGKALYRKYRSKNLSEIVGQEHITQTLSNALKSGAISHAYLFTGPHGVGKTSIARILAHEVNEFPYDEQSTHVDIIEIDAASNRRIDEMRDLRDRVSIAPVDGKYKVYIIDEVHMLTREAFNALLKTLEEPPEHVIFILATTEAHKLPETIVSRTQRYTFKPIERTKAVEHLKDIAKREKLDISDQALGLIADHGKGSFRDSISLLDQISRSESKVDGEHIRSMLGVPSEQSIQNITESLSGDSKTVVDELQNMKEQGYDAPQIAHALHAAIRAQIIDGSLQINDELALKLLHKLLRVPASPDPFSALEITLLGVQLRNNPSRPKPPQPAAVQAPVSVSEEVAQEAAPAPVEEPEDPEEIEAPEPNQPTQVGDFDWNACLDVIKQRYNTLYGVLRMAQPEVSDDTLTLYFSFGFHQKKIADKKHAQQIADIIKDQCGTSYKVQSVVDKSKVKLEQPKETAPQPSKPAQDLAKDADNNAVDAISNIFGGAEVLE